MRISAIKYQTNPVYTGENRPKHNKLKSLAGATVIAIAASSPIENSEAQIIPYVPNFNYPTYTTRADAINTPKCFKIGDIALNSDTDKSSREIFNELDINGNGVISSNEVVEIERSNWNEENIYPYTSTNAKNTQKRFKALAEVYNEDNSNPNTINYNEYRKIMSDYEKSNDYNFVPIYPYPYYYTLPPVYHYRPHRPHIHHTPPPPPRHHHHRY